MLFITNGPWRRIGASSGSRPISSASAGASALSATAPPGVSRADLVRFLLWLLLVLSVVANTVASSAGAGLGTHLACGAVTALTAAVLVVRRLKGRR